MPTYLGIRYLIWAAVVWIAVAGTFGVILIYRLLISYRSEDELFMHPAEIRDTLAHIHHVNRMAVLFGAVSAISLLLILAGWMLGFL